jgi:hypothetical protein
MDILHLVDRLEELFNNSRPIPLSRSVVVDENAFMDIIDQMRISIPDDIKKSSRLLRRKTASWRRRRKKPTAPWRWRARKAKR